MLNIPEMLLMDKYTQIYTTRIIRVKTKFSFFIHQIFTIMLMSLQFLSTFIIDFYVTIFIY